MIYVSQERLLLGRETNSMSGFGSDCRNSDLCISTTERVLYYCNREEYNHVNHNNTHKLEERTI